MVALNTLPTGCRAPKAAVTMSARAPRTLLGEERMKAMPQRSAMLEAMALMTMLETSATATSCIWGVASRPRLLLARKASVSMAEERELK